MSLFPKKFLGTIMCRSRTVPMAYPCGLNPLREPHHRRPNIDRVWALSFGKALGLTYEDGIPRGEQKSFGPDFQRPKAEQLGLLDTPWMAAAIYKRPSGPATCSTTSMPCCTAPAIATAMPSS